MSTETVVKSPKSNREFTTNYEFGDDLEASVQLFGKEVIHSKFVAQANTDLGNAVRAKMNKRKKDAQGNDTDELEFSMEQITEFVAGHKPGVTVRGPGKKKETVDTLITEYQAADTTEERKQTIENRLREISEEGKKAAVAAKAIS